MSQQFQSLNITKKQLEVIEELGFTTMTPVQAQSLPLLLEGKDIRAQSETGSGKTLAYTVPLLEKIKIESGVVQALVLCPTRELGTQVAREIRKLGRKHSGLQVLVVSGGQPIYLQVNALKKGVHIIVGTPGRVLDLLSRRHLDLSTVQTVVLDEADRMLDMGFSEDMEVILKELPTQRRTYFFSATFPESIQYMSKKYQKNPIEVIIKQENVSEQTSTIIQSVFEVEKHEKDKALLWILKEKSPKSAIIFSNFKVSVNEISHMLKDCGVSADALHGDLNQSERDRVMAKFRNKSIRILVASDVAARGLDVENLDMVINYDLPKDLEVYVHRVGRTGRAGKKGEAVLFAEKREFSKVNEISKQYGFEIKEEEFSTFINSEELENLNLDSEMETLYISGGRKEKIRPGDILGALTGEAGALDAKEVGKIEIFDHFSYVAISKKCSEKALKALQSGKIKGKRFKVDFVY